jgi:hypothetical protein
MSVAPVVLEIIVCDKSDDSFVLAGFFSQFGDIKRLRLSRNKKVSVGEMLGASYYPLELLFETHVFALLGLTLVPFYPHRLPSKAAEYQNLLMFKIFFYNQNEMWMLMISFGLTCKRFHDCNYSTFLGEF